MRKQAKAAETVRIERPKRAKLSEEVILRRMAALDERKERIIASIRKGKD